MKKVDFLIVSGLSGAGKSRVAATLEDIGFYCVDNMPAELIPAFAEIFFESRRHERVALVIDIRMGEPFDVLFEAVETLRRDGHSCRILFVEAAREVILRRYKETRRTHPLSGSGMSAEDMIDEERHRLGPVRERADFLVDTTNTSTAYLREYIIEQFGDKSVIGLLTVHIISFGHKYAYGPPAEADMTFDVRFLPNPYHEESLRLLTGLDQPVFDYVTKAEQTQDFLTRLYDFMDFLLPQYVAEGRVSLVVGVGCTGGRHRSVTIARLLEAHIRAAGYRTLLTHRDVSR